MSDFHIFQTAVAQHFNEMVATGKLFRTATESDRLWQLYLASFPPGSNPVFRERTEHDCSCCRHFIRQMGNVVTIRGSKVVTIWDCEVAEPYGSVAKALAAFVKAAPISDIFLHHEFKVGVSENHEMTDAGVTTWNHFAVQLPHRSNSGISFHCDGPDLATKLGEARTTREVFDRALREFTRDAVETLSDIIAQNSLYRGNEYVGAVTKFAQIKAAFDLISNDRDRELFTWLNFASVPLNVARIRNTAIGTLLIDLSAGMDLEGAVRKFETSIMAPQNYKRPTALVSQKQIDAARANIEELGLRPALERRHASIRDISINDVIWADRSVRSSMKDDVFDQIEAKTAPAPRNLDRVDTIDIAKFLADVVPSATSMEVMFDNSMINNLVSIIAPQHTDSRRLFAWDNNFSWSYRGEVADSIRERVKRAGGNVEGELCCRLAWSNYDDLDFHMMEPGGGHIYFPNKGMVSRCGGTLDVDMNAGGGMTRSPVENIFYRLISNMRPGEYQLMVHQFSKRETRDVGFTVEIDVRGDVRTFSFNQSLRTNESVNVAAITVDAKGNVSIRDLIPSSRASRVVWGLPTLQFARVNTLLLSPNHWEGAGARGNKHYFFALDGALTDEPARGFYNEFLRPELHEHRKVIELVGSKMTIPPSPVQLSGLGFSDTKRQEVLVKVGGSFTRTLKVQI